MKFGVGFGNRGFHSPGLGNSAFAERRSTAGKAANRLLLRCRESGGAIIYEEIDTKH
jgi:hypothetical protein